MKAGLVELDKTVAEAGENRKAEHEDFQARHGKKAETREFIPYFVL